MADGDEKTDIAVLKNKVEVLQSDVKSLEDSIKERDRRDVSFLTKALWTIGGVLTTAFAFLWAAIKDRFGL